MLVEPCLRDARGEALARPWHLGSECDGGVAQHVRVAARHAHRIESPLDDIARASFPCSHATAEKMLARAGIGAGEVVLVTGTPGGVGSAAVQLARARGAEVISGAGGAKAARLRDLGAARTLDRGADLLAGLGPDSVDAVVDLVAGPDCPALPGILRPGGRSAVACAIGGPLVTVDMRTLYLKGLGFFGTTVHGPQVFPDLAGRIGRGEIAPLVAAQEVFLRKDDVGKIVLTLP
ncbi:zinc-binding dehydrogenase [Poseidonocella sp. HB161398]|uniref:zinc-binding dehydrogenase n=1 Tax=Poseidonocella sp. HB161398 TaxID=2320855 RepID=UPI001F102013|nr:zinc-binding dehydrogenase [Poseidonocella sp. HB161398]